MITPLKVAKYRIRRTPIPGVTPVQPKAAETGRGATIADLLAHRAAWRGGPGG